MGFDLVFRVLRQEEYLEGWKYPPIWTFVFSKATFEHSLSIQAPEVIDKSRYYGTLYSMFIIILKDKMSCFFMILELRFHRK